MRKMSALLWIFVLFPSITWAQEKVEAPVWNIGDKWVFTQGSIEVVGSDQNSYTLNFSKDTCRVENKGLIILNKSNLNRIYISREDKREKYPGIQRRILNFPLNLGKEWSDTGTVTPSSGPMKGTTLEYFEAFKVLRWEDVKVQGGIFKSLKLEYAIDNKTTKTSGKSIYWYSPEAKYFVKCQYDKNYFLNVTDWELTSFHLKK
jgi:hypothetical protein